MRILGTSLLFLLCIAAVALYAGMVRTSAAINPSYDPQWAIQDTWTVRFKVKRVRRPKEPTLSPPEIENVIYRYTVTAIEGDLVNIVAAPDGDGLSSWLLTFDKSKLALVSVEEVTRDGERINHPNPFIGDAYMSKLGEFHQQIIHDFPRLPDTEISEWRSLKPIDSGTPKFIQYISFESDTATAVLTRTDPVSTREHSTTIVWRRGDKWWSSAVTTLGGDVEVSGELLP